MSTNGRQLARVTRMVERITELEAALERCRALADKAEPGTAYAYCTQIEDIAKTALEDVYPITASR